MNAGITIKNFRVRTESGDTGITLAEAYLRCTYFHSICESKLKYTDWILSVYSDEAAFYAGGSPLATHRYVPGSRPADTDTEQDQINAANLELSQPAMFVAVVNMIFQLSAMTKDIPDPDNPGQFVSWIELDAPPA